jgi:KDO2-lipid IV(A) lauroyltransferase
VEENTAAFTRAIESHVRRHPDQWFWFHKRWKTKPYCEMDKKKRKKKVGKV